MAMSKEELKREKVSENIKNLQILQNKKIRIICGLRIEDHIKLKSIREKNQNDEC